MQARATETAFRGVSFRLRVLCYRAESGRWIAQALEKDIAAQGENLPAARRAFVRALLDNVVVGAEHGDPDLNCVSAAPKEFWNRWEQSDELRHALPSNLDDVPPPWVINALAEVRVAS